MVDGYGRSLSLTFGVASGKLDIFVCLDELVHCFFVFLIKFGVRGFKVVFAA